MSRFREITKGANREKNILDLWKRIELFRKSCEKTSGGPLFVFYEGPPTTNGYPGLHHILSRAFKDIYIRFYSQRGYQVPRRAGWDCHGLPVEREVEKKLGINSKQEIEESYGIERFNQLCRQSVLKYISEWNRFSERMAFFVDLQNPYYTMDDFYIESIWSLLKIIWEKGLIYRGFKVVPCDPILGTTMSDAEVDLGYRQVEDPSLTVRFPVADNYFGEKAFFLVWTTTPWTLTANTALALAADEDYLIVEHRQATDKRDKEILICAAARAEALLGENFRQDGNFQVIKTVRGRELTTIAYRRIIDFTASQTKRREQLQGGEEIKKGEIKKGWYTLSADFVSMDTGSGIVHIAPSYGADDLALAKDHDLPIIHTVGLDGKFMPDTPLAGRFFKEADSEIIDDLKRRGLVWKSERYRHSYPFGYRTGAPLIYYAKDAWYIRTTALKEKLLDNNANIHWVPSHIKEGRFGDWLRNNRDWALSRERYWGTPLPIWSDGEDHFQLIGSREELSRLCKRDLSAIDLHRPSVDQIQFQDRESGKLMSRVPEVIDCWFDSGAMPYAQWGWPIRGEDDFKKFFPADFISEAIDQTRGWFYTLLAISTAVSDISSYRNVVCLGHVLDEKGEKMSKSKGNVVSPWEVFDTHGADAIRWHFLSGAPPGNSRRIGRPGSPNDSLIHVQGFLNMLINSVNFFSLYANIDGISIDNHWEESPIKGALPFSQRPELDRWILSLLQDLVENVTRLLEARDCYAAGAALTNFLEGLSNWYIRRNRRRFWKGGKDADKWSAYDSLYRSLLTLARLMAPFTPFIAEEIFQCLVTEPLSQADNPKNQTNSENQANSEDRASSEDQTNSENRANSEDRAKNKDQTKERNQAPQSVHLASWPKADHKNWYDAAILREGELVKQAAFLGRTARMQSGIKIRQPLRRMWLYLEQKENRSVIEKNKLLLCEELNIKEIEFLDDSTHLLEYELKPNLPRLGKKLGADVRQVREFLKTADSRELVGKIGRGENILVPQGPLLEAEDILVKSISKEGSSAVESNGMLAALDTVLDQELREEGIARDLLRHIQELRKSAKLSVTERVTLAFQGYQETIGKTLQSFGDYIAKEALAQLLSEAEREKKEATEKCIAEKEIGINQEKVLIKLWRQ